MKIGIIGAGQIGNDGNTRVEQLIALVADHAVARAVFTEAVRRRPGKVTTSAKVASAG
jgi:hypothetical protein